MSPNPPVISVMLAVEDATAAARWYADGVGAEELWNLGSVVGLSVQGAPILLGQPEGNGWDTPISLGVPTVEWRCSSRIRTGSSGARCRPARTGAPTRSATTRRHGECTARAASLIPSGTCGSSATGRR